MGLRGERTVPLSHARRTVQVKDRLSRPLAGGSLRLLHPTHHICAGSSCYVRGSDQVAETISRLIQEKELTGQVEITGAFCMEECSTGVPVRVGDVTHCQVMPDEAEAFFCREVQPHLRPGGER